MILRHHFYNVSCARGNFSQHFIISSLSYNVEYCVWNVNAILRILTHNPTSRNVTLTDSYIFTISSHMTPVAKFISIVVFVGWRSVFDHTNQYQHILLYASLKLTVFTLNSV